jgi:hypothetical protein
MFCQGMLAQPDYPAPEAAVCNKSGKEYQSRDFAVSSIGAGKNDTIHEYARILPGGLRFGYKGPSRRTVVVDSLDGGSICRVVWAGKEWMKVMYKKREIWVPVCDVEIVMVHE